MDAISVWLGRELKKRLVEQDAILGAVVTGGSVADYAHYKFICGQLNAYRKVAEWINDADPDERIKRPEDQRLQNVY